MHAAAIERAAEMQLRALAEIAQQYATEVDATQLSFEEGIRYEDFAAVLDGAKTDPEMKAQLNEVLRDQLVPAMQQIFNPPQQEGMQ